MRVLRKAKKSTGFKKAAIRNARISRATVSDAPSAKYTKKMEQRARIVARELGQAPSGSAPATAAPTTQAPQAEEPINIVDADM
jgi:hypothetical protein